MTRFNKRNSSSPSLKSLFNKRNKIAKMGDKDKDVFIPSLALLLLPTVIGLASAYQSRCNHDNVAFYYPAKKRNRFQAWMYSIACKTDRARSALMRWAES